MPYVPIGKQSRDSANTPTLRQFLSSGGTLPVSNGVKIIFFPNKAPNYTFITEKFKVSILEGTELYNAVVNQIDEWADGNAYLTILPNTDKPGAFELCIDSNESADWERFEWGVKINVLERKSKPARSKKATRPSDAEQAAVEF